MSFLGSIKNRVLGRHEEDFGDIRSHVVGEPVYGEEPIPGSEQSLPMNETPMPPTNQGIPEVPEVPGRFEREPISLEKPLEREPPVEKSSDYELMDRLSIIEAQLSAIRSQTETINERLKNLELRFGRR